MILLAATHQTLTHQMVSLLIVMHLTDDSSDGDTSQDDPDNDDMQDEEPADESTHSADAIYGAWQGACISSGDNYIQTILAIDDSIIAEDVHQYSDSSCTGVPQGLYFPVRIY